MLPKIKCLIFSIFIFLLFTETQAQQYIVFQTATNDTTSGLMVFNKSMTDLLEISGANKIHAFGDFTVRGDLQVEGEASFFDTTNFDAFVSVQSGCYYGSWGSCSDFRLKKNINLIPNALNRILNLKGVSFNWRTDEFPKFNFEEGSNLGFIAQDMENVFPELVRTEKNGYKSIAYDNLTPVLVEAIKEQQKIISNQTAEINAIESELNILKSELNEQKKEIERIKKSLKQ